MSVFAEFVGLDLRVDTVPDETTILHFRHLFDALIPCTPRECYIIAVTCCGRFTELKLSRRCMVSATPATVVHWRFDG